MAVRVYVVSVNRGVDAVRQPLAEGNSLPPVHDLPEGRGVTIEHVYRRERPRLLGFLKSRAPTEDVEDVLQESFARIIAHDADEAGRISHPRGHLFRVARNLAIDAGRSFQFRMKIHAPLDEANFAGPDQVTTLEARDVLHRLEAVLQRLKPKTREIFLAHRLDGYTYGEIAARTGISVKGVEKHMSQAIALIDRSMRAR